MKGFKLCEEELEKDYDKQDDISYYRLNRLIGLRKTGTGWERKNRPYMYYPLLLDKEFMNFFTSIHHELEKRVKSYEIKDASTKKRVQLNKAVLDSQEFIDLWNRINEKTIYSLDFDSNNLISKSIEDIKNMPKISAPRIFSSKDTIDKIVRESGIEGRTIREDEDSLVYNIQLPDIITDLQNKTDLTRKTIIDILINSKRLEDFKRNPQKYIEEVTKIIRKNTMQFATQT